MATRGWLASGVPRLFHVFALHFSFVLFGNTFSWWPSISIAPISSRTMEVRVTPCGTDDGKSKEQHYHIGLLSLKADYECNVQRDFNALRDLRKDLIICIKQAKGNATCNLLRQHGDSLRDLLEYGFPERKLFGSLKTEEIEERTKKIQNCIHHIVNSHWKLCELGDSCQTWRTIRNFFKADLLPTIPTVTRERLPLLSVQNDIKTTFIPQTGEPDIKQGKAPSPRIVKKEINQYPNQVAKTSQEKVFSPLLAKPLQEGKILLREMNVEHNKESPTPHTKNGQSLPVPSSKASPRLNKQEPLFPATSIKKNPHKEQVKRPTGRSSESDEDATLYDDIVDSFKHFGLSPDMLSLHQPWRRA